MAAIAQVQMRGASGTSHTPRNLCGPADLPFPVHLGPEGRAAMDGSSAAEAMGARDLSRLAAGNSTAAVLTGSGTGLRMLLSVMISSFEQQVS